MRESPVELASAAIEHVRQPFAAQVDFFRDKLNLPTQSWTDIWHEQHDNSFVVAGAAQADLVQDLRAAVDSAVADGTTLATFREAFDGIVEKHGWSYRGGRNWRTRVIYDTNVRSSYSAGRYRQMKDMAETRPFWRYRHSHASENPRQQHLAWDGMVLRHDDPWWETNYPINGWGCKCYVEALNARDLERLGKSGPDKAPPLKMREVTVGARGPNPRTVQVPDGIDPGFAYAPGRSARRNVDTSRIPSAPPDPPPPPQPDRPQPPAGLNGFIAEGRTIREALVAEAGGAASEGFEGRFRSALRKRLRAERGAGTVAAEVSELRIRGAKITATRVRKAAAELPDSWVQAGNAVPLASRGTSKRGGYSKPVGDRGGLIRTNTDPGNALHEYAHHLQIAMPGLDQLFHLLHRRRTAGDPRVSVTRGLNEPGRDDNYVDAYAGREYGPDETPLEVLTMTLQQAFHPIWGTDHLKRLVEKDPEVLDLLLGALFRYDP